MFILILKYVLRWRFNIVKILHSFNNPLSWFMFQDAFLFLRPFSSHYRAAQHSTYVYNVSGSVYQYVYTVNGSVYQYVYTVNGSVCQYLYTVNGSIYQYVYNVNGSVYQFVYFVNVSVCQYVYTVNDSVETSKWSEQRKRASSLNQQ